MSHRLNFRSFLITSAAVITVAGFGATATLHQSPPPQSSPDGQTEARAKIVAPSRSAAALSSSRSSAGVTRETVELADLPTAFTVVDIGGRRAELSNNNGSARWNSFSQWTARRSGSGNGSGGRVRGFAGGIGGFNGGWGRLRRAGTDSGSAQPARRGAGSSSGGGASRSPKRGIFSEHITPVPSDSLAQPSVIDSVTAGGGSLAADVGGMAATPEPGSLLLIGTGLVGILGALRRRLI